MLAPPLRVKLTKPAGRSRAKLTADSIDTRFRYTHKLCLIEEERVGKSVHLALSTDCDYLLHRNTVKGYDVFLYQNIIILFTYLNNNFRTFADF